MVFGATPGATADDVDLGLPPARRMSSSADGPLGNGRRRGRWREGESSSAAAVPETVVLVLGNFQGVVVLDMGVVTVSLGTIVVVAPVGVVYIRSTAVTDATESGALRTCMTRRSTIHRRGVGYSRNANEHPNTAVSAADGCSKSSLRFVPELTG